MTSSDSQIAKSQCGHPKRAELLDVNINTGTQSINNERAYFNKPVSCTVANTKSILVGHWTLTLGRQQGTLFHCQSVVVWLGKPNFGSCWCDQPFVYQVAHKILFSFSYWAWLWSWLTLLSTPKNNGCNPSHPFITPSAAGADLEFLKGGVGGIFNFQLDARRATLMQPTRVVLGHAPWEISRTKVSEMASPAFCGHFGAKLKGLKSCLLEVF